MASYTWMDAADFDRDGARGPERQERREPLATDPVIDPIPLSEHASFADFAEAIRRRLGKESQVPGYVVTDGLKFKPTVGISLHGLNYLQVETWSPGDLESNMDRAERAGFKTNAVYLNLVHEPFSKAEAELVQRYGDALEGGGFDLEDELRRETAAAPSSGGEETGDDAKEDAGAADTSSRRQSARLHGEPPITPGIKTARSREATEMPATTLRDVAERRGEGAVRGVRHADKPLTVVTPSARSITDVTRVAKLRNEVANKLDELHQDLPTVMERLFPHGWTSTGRLHPFIVVDLLDSLKYQDQLLRMLRATAAEGDHTEQGRAFKRALSPESLDKTLANLMAEGAVTGEMGTLESVYGVPPVGTLVMAAARSYYSAFESKASIALRAKCAAVRFINRAGELNIVDAAGEISKAVGVAQQVRANCHWDRAGRSLAANIAEASRIVMVVYHENGQREDWGEFSSGVARKLAMRPQEERYTREEVVETSTRLDLFARLRNKETAILAAAKARAGGDSW